MGCEQRMQGSRSKPNTMSSTEDLMGCIKPQPLWCTLQEEEEEAKVEECKSKGRPAAKWVHQRRRGRKEGFPVGSVFDRARYQNAYGESCGGDHNSPRNGPYNRDGSRALSQASATSSAGWKKERNQKIEKKKQPGKEPKNL